MDELFLCDIQDMELPIGFEMQADIYGLNVSDETQENQGTMNLMDNTSMPGSALK